MEIRVEHAASGETFDHAQLLNPQQHQSRPDVIKKLDSNEQNPERNPVLLTLGCESNTVMSNKHCQSIVGRLCQTPSSDLVALCFSIADGNRMVQHSLIDRKSTRLNSSHEWISYAVFCLKKKNTVLNGSRL